MIIIIKRFIKISALFIVGQLKFEKLILYLDTQESENIVNKTQTKYYTKIHREINKVYSKKLLFELL